MAERIKLVHGRHMARTDRVVLVLLHQRMGDTMSTCQRCGYIQAAIMGYQCITCGGPTTNLRGHHKDWGALFGTPPTEAQVREDIGASIIEHLDMQPEWPTVASMIDDIMVHFKE